MTLQFNPKTDVPLIAILRGIEPSDALRIGNILIEAGFKAIEVPLNSPDALESIKLMVDEFGDNYLVGAGTVTTPELAEQVIATGAKLIVTPNFNERVVRLGVEAGCQVYPGVISPTEAFNALQAGATGIKLFPVTILGISGVKALKSVLPKEALCFAVGGINPNVECLKPYLDIGIDGFGLGASLYSPNLSDKEIRENAQQFIHAYNETCSLGG
ncbi:2-dehydro-3-deoxy-6-phosphogalactonate aldolase [Vibrio sonorensis]|uniref:2-dehydro-3-deoxy-6-phosphogalactonate aldolase n=1 Tax=Vibrio sonorensis TaxID=1004316 RepID=UPI0008D97EBE|nr:2-dehydro-3-deoxy-6-phosphogalactonate aldolase [Vibrio sonorensis]